MMTFLADWFKAFQGLKDGSKASPTRRPGMDALALKTSLPGRLARYADSFLASGIAFGVDAALLAAICDRESRGGDALTPVGPGGWGDHQHGHGLMQIDDRSHGSFLSARFPNGSPLWTSPSFNLLYAAWILRNDYQHSGSWPVAVAAYNAGLTRALKAANGDSAGLLSRLDAITTGGNYVSDVLKKQETYASQRSS